MPRVHHADLAHIRARLDELCVLRLARLAPEEEAEYEELAAAEAELLDLRVRA